MYRSPKPKKLRCKVKIIKTRRSHYTKLSPKSLRKAQRRRKRSSIELTIYKWLEDEGIIFTKEKAIGQCHVDVVIEDIMLACEVQGCYFHYCRRCYAEPNRQANIKRLRDRNRYKFLKSQGYEVIEIWECDIKKNPEKTKNKLLKLIKKRRS